MGQVEPLVVVVVPADASAPLARGSTIDQQWLITAVLGRGGSGDVYRCRHLHDPAHPEVAIKLLTDASDIARFSRERMVMDGAAHPHVVQLLDIGKHDHQPYLVLELASGGSVNDYLGNSGALDPRLASWIIIQAVSGLRARHVVHRDLKPHNLLIALAPGQRRAAFHVGDAVNGSRVMIADFGLAKELSGNGRSITITNQIMGTPLYMSPEQCRNTKQVGVESDIYSLGVILFELLTGRPPFDGADPYAIIAQHINDLPAYPNGFDPVLRQVVARCLEKDATHRYRTLRSFEEALRLRCGLPASATSEGVRMDHPGWMQTWLPFWRRKKS